MLSAALLMMTSAAANVVEMPADIQKANIFHAFDWKFSDIREELPRIAEAGFGAVQVSPVQGNCGEGADWYFAYMPYDLKMTSWKCNGNGSRDELTALCDEAEKYGIKIVVDVVANHINKSKANRNGWWNEEGRERNKGAINFGSRKSIITGNLGEYHDIVSENPEVQARCVEFLEDLKSMGVKGIRWDAAKHIGLPSEDCDFWKSVTAVDGLWHYGEILDNPGGSNDKDWKVAKEYAEYIGMTDNSICKSWLSGLRSSSMHTQPTNLTASYKSAGKGIPADRIVYWGESHDSYANTDGYSKSAAQDAVDRAYILGACRRYETALYFSRPAEKEYKKIKMGVKGSTHGLEDPTVKAVNNFRIAMGDREEAMEMKPGSTGHFTLVRKDGGALIMTGKKSEAEVSVANVDGFIPAGEYRDLVTGNIFTVTAETISGKVSPLGVGLISVLNPASVEDLEIERPASEAAYYTIQGVRVESPSEGLYIRVKDGKATKVML